jgi:catechol 2,3-dioxygenase-like lactoylglutathione lyase family enzyme
MRDITAGGLAGLLVLAQVPLQVGGHVPKLEQVNIVVRDMEAMGDFYRRLGVALRDGPPGWAPHHQNTGDVGGVDFDLDSESFATVWNTGSVSHLERGDLRDVAS